ncbi:uncharacterized protein TEOVI_000176900 [Trypanosoma equiperdum]|uniref:CHCH domain-containing protein n=3 Tax=Trypanozoon TaxID=39700 RepID=Q381K8_TRYB2|nr:hypothetical protein, conserved [Trypanosoma brucei brucei TREU927]EAN80523.1 hypothetical protein, conserved [Trypanosoma brucei brucei TREU927]SCU70196.1 hypothetical protein, conserved [Trypanosoma equiperdum]
MTTSGVESVSTTVNEGLKPQTEGSEERRPTTFKELRPSWLTPFFGANEPEPYKPPERGHPCKAFSRQVHECLDRNGNNVDFCQSKLALLQSCLKELGL